MKDKGYTLIELLGVMIILAVLIAFVVPSVINFIKSSTEEKDKLTRDLVYNAADMFIEDNASKLSFNNKIKYCVSINTLIENNYLKGNLEYNGEKLDNKKSVRVTYTDTFNYEILDSEACSICKLVDGNYKEIGSKYQCKVKNNMETGFEDGYYFYLLSMNDDETINLIMERNIYYDSDSDVGLVATQENRGLVTWYADSRDNSFGPVTAMNYLYDATKDWNKVPNIKMNYNDENINNTLGYGSIVTTGTIIEITKKDGTVTAQYNKLKARMPYKSELSYYDITNKTNVYLYDYLSLSNTIQINPITGIYGYWTLSSSSDDTAMRVINNGSINTNFVDYDNTNGVRPVITVPNVFVLD